LERLGYPPAAADRALRKVLSDDGTGTDAEGLVRRALQLLTEG
jgi:Holliday junction resolvasome RuvABC DNA-binding subunit